MLSVNCLFVSVVHPRSYCHHRNGLVRRLRLVVRGPLIMKLLLVHPLISSFTSPLFWVLFKYLFPLDPSGGRSDQSCMYVLYCIILKRGKSVEGDEKDRENVNFIYSCESCSNMCVMTLNCASVIWIQSNHNAHAPNSQFVVWGLDKWFLLVNTTKVEFYEWML